MTLGTSPYVQDFDALPTMPVGWTVRTGASATSLGTTNPLGLNTWNSNSGEFRTVAAAEAPLTAASNATAQAGATDRALAVRPTASFADPGAAFTLQLDNTIGKTGFSLSLKHMTFDHNASRVITYTVQYTTVAAGTSGWTNLGTYTTAAWGFTLSNYSFGTAIDNIGTSVWIRVVQLTASTGSGNRDTYGIDDVKITWAASATPNINIVSPNPAAPAANTAQGSMNNLLYRTDLTVSSSSAVMTAASFTTSAGYVAADIADFKLWYQNTPTFTGSGTLLGTKLTGLGPGAQNFTGLSQVLPVGTGYLFLTSDIGCSATVTDNFNINAIGTGNLSFVTASQTATPAPFAGGLQTITIGGTPVDPIGAAIGGGNGQLTISWTNPLCFDEIMIVATDNASVSSVPTGDGTLYTANVSYNDGTNFPNLNPNEFCIYKGGVSPVIMNNLVNGTTYNMKIFTRLGTAWSSGVALSGTPAATVTVAFRSIASGQWNDYTIWQKNTGSWVAAAAGEFPNSTSSDVEIQSPNTVVLNARGYAVKNLVVDAGAKLWCNTNVQNKFLNIYADLQCNGTIGNGSIQDDISFNFGGPTAHLYGTGTFDCDRMRKNNGSNAITTLTIDINVGTWYNGTVLWNNFTGYATQFNVIINSIFTCNNSGIVAIDGMTGAAVGNSYGTYTVNGTLTVPQLYLTTNNASPYNCTVAIGTAGVINAGIVSMAASTGTATHILSIAAGGKLNISGISGIIPFSSTGNTYTLNAGSTVEYSAAGSEPVESGLPYSNLTVSGSGTKTPNGNVNVGNIFTLSSGTYSMSGLQTTIAANGTVTGNGGNFGAAALGGTVSFAGNGNINGTTALTFRNLNINAGTVTVSLTNCNAQNLNLTGGIFSIGAANQFNMLTAGLVTATAGDFATGANGGILNFPGTGTFSGTCNPYNVYASGAVNFGSQTVTIQNGGSFRLNAGGAVSTNAPFYGTNSSLVYNSGGANTAATEWTPTATSGRGVPFHVSLLNPGSATTLGFAALAVTHTMLGDLTINDGTQLTLSATSGADLLIAGNWTRGSTGTFVNSARKVTFNGTANDQVITVVNGGTEKFGYVAINKAAGLRLIQSAAPSATNLSILGNPLSGSATVPLSLINGNLDLNQQTLNFSSWNGNQNNIQIDGTAGNLTRNINSTGGTGYFIVTNSNGSARTLNISRISAAASLLAFGTGVTLINTGTTAASNIDFGNTITTVNGTLQLNVNGFVTVNPPTYGTNSNLVYNSGGTFNRNLEWSTLTGPGYPYNVTVQNASLLQLNFPNPNGNANRAIAGSLSIAPGAALLLSTTAANTLTVAANLQIDGTLTLPAVAGGNLYVGANWNRSATGIFTPNAAAVYFNGTANSTITANGGELYPYLYLSKTALSQTLTLLDDITVTKEFALNTGTFDPAAKNVTLRSNVAGTASFGKVGAAADVTYSGAGRFIVERYIPTGVSAGQHSKSWQYLAVPDNGGQTINAGWQEGHVLPVIGTSGLGIILSSNTAGAGFDIIGGVGPTIKTYVPSTDSWIGAANTLSVPLYNQRGYFVFVRGDRNVSAYNTPATATTLRSTGKLFVPGSNPPPSTTVPAGKFESIGNPYASTIDLVNITVPAAPAIDSVFYLWDPLLAGSYGLGGFQTISSVTGFKPTPGGTANYSSALPYTKIQSGQAFMVHATGGGTISFTENAKTSGSSMVYRTSPFYENRRGFLRAELYVANGSMADANIVAFDNSFSDEFESNDAIKILNGGENFGISSNGHTLAVEARNLIIRVDSIQYFISNLRLQQVYHIKFSPENINGDGIAAFLNDRFLNTTTPVSFRDSTGIDFSVTADPASSASGRFVLIFIKKVHTSVSTLEEAARDKGKKMYKARIPESALISVYPNPVVNKIMKLSFSHSLPGNYSVELINNEGQPVYSQTVPVNSGYFTASINLKKIPAGCYSLSVTDADGKITTQPVIVY